MTIAKPTVTLMGLPRRLRSTTNWKNSTTAITGSTSRTTVISPTNSSSHQSASSVESVAATDPASLNRYTAIP